MDPVAIMGKIQATADKIGVKIRMEFSITGVKVWFGEQDPRDAGYPNNTLGTIDDLLKYMKTKFGERVSEMENSARLEMDRAGIARRALLDL